MKISLPNFALPSMASVVSRATQTAIGVDIGTSSVKIVQLRVESGAIVLDTYGEISLSAYTKPSSAGETPVLLPQDAGRALIDLMHEVQITSRAGGIAIPASAAFITVITTPTRDGAQLQTHMDTEMQKYIPVPVNDVYIEWSVLHNKEEQNVFATKAAHAEVTATTQQVLVTAVNKDKVEIYRHIFNLAGIAAHFYEIETVSIARAAFPTSAEPVLLVDMGASSTKMSVIENDIVYTTHITLVGGNELTRSLATASGLPFEKAESLKREWGLHMPHSSSVDTSHLQASLTTPLDLIAEEMKRVISSFSNSRQKPVSRVILVGGGACLTGIVDHFSKISIPVEIARPFEKTRIPIVLGDRLTADGPIFANAIGLALRAITGK
ncbi:MAG: Type pilus assembly protein PilM, type pilus assembly protein PilM [Candidatus Adlerbacteria bacterium]|nr:Type pilus assembly protein PilM, type pilus assembly protein PilM [Candidatus Adlerbacteria bacterium]